MPFLLRVNGGYDGGTRGPQPLAQNPVFLGLSTILVKLIAKFILILVVSTLMTAKNKSDIKGRGENSFKMSTETQKDLTALTFLFFLLTSPKFVASIVSTFSPALVHSEGSYPPHMSCPVGRPTWQGMWKA